MSIETHDEIGQRQPPPGKLTYEEFLDWCDEDTLAEWVDGEVIVTSPASYPHATIADFLLAIIQYWAQYWDLGVVVSAPFQMKLPYPLRRGREPDLIFVTNEHLSRFQKTYLNGAADLVVEILSPESVKRDREDKFHEYERAAIPEYWMLDPDARRAEFYRLGDDGRYQLILGGGSGEYRSETLRGFHLAVDWLWQEPLPKLREVLQALDLLH
jgi:Uma2 family endonuclease